LQGKTSEDVMTVNANAWRRLPIAPRETNFDADDAIKRIQAWAHGDVSRFNSMFLWRNSDAPANNRNSYRLPIGDIVNGKPTMVPRAIFAAATILSGAHGGLEGVVDEDEKLDLKRVITNIYEVLQKAYGDPRTVPPWLRGGNDKEQALNAASMEEEGMELHELDALITASVRTAWVDVGVADANHAWSAKSASARLWEASEGDIRAYGRGFLWHDPSAPEQRNSYKIPIADIVDDRMQIIPSAVITTAQLIASGNGETLAIPDPDLEVVSEVVDALRARLDNPEALTAAGFPVAPPDEWFAMQNLPGPTPLTITADGRVSGHAFLWGTCHQGIGDRCVVPPRTSAGYRYFANGSVLTASGAQVKVGKITKGTGHASIRLGWIPAADHYDNTGTVVAVTSIHEDRFGGQLAGAIVPNASEADVAELRRSPISGDWRRINGNLELVAALAVNTPGFPIVSLSASGDPDCILAAGVQAADDTDPGCGCSEVSVTADGVIEDRSEALTRFNKISSDFEKVKSSRRARRLTNIQAIMGGK
jgi:hypothetical protein